MLKWSGDERFMKKKMYVIGLCGRSGSGKSTVASAFGKRGMKGVDCDELTHEIYEPGSECLKALELSFGESVIKADGRLDRKALSKIAFSSEERTKLLNRVTHGFILKGIEEKLEMFKAQGEDLIFIDAPLLFEAGLEKRVDAVVCVIASEKESIKRVAVRDGRPESEVVARLKKQKSAEFLKKNSHLCVYNAGTLAELERKAAKALLWAFLRFRLPMSKLRFKERL